MTPLRVAVDATAIPVDRGGVGRYVDNLLPALAAQGVILTVFCQARDAERVSALPGLGGAEILALSRRIERRPVRLVWEQTALPRAVKRSRAHLLLSPHYTMPLASGVPVVVTLHDATFFSHPEVHTAVKRRFFTTWTRIAVGRAAALVVPSDATGREVRRFVGGEPARFHVAYHGVDRTLFHPAEPEACARLSRSLGVADVGYVGFLGTLEPRKNVPALVRGWAGAVVDRPRPPALVLAGSRGWDSGLETALADVPRHLRVLTPGYLPLQDLPAFLAGAEVLAYPSLGEGFGLPVLEAMACGAAVLTTRELSLPEVGGDAVAYTGTSAPEIERELRALLDGPDRQRELRARAIERAGHFTWAASAAAHVSAFESALRHS